MYINKVTLIGNLTRNPELKALPSGMSVANFSIATNRSWKDKEGTKQEDVQYHNCVVFGKQAETINQYVKKGDQLFVEGRLQTRTWEKDGDKRYATEVMVENFQFGQKAKQSEAPKVETSKTTEIEYPTDEVNPEDIPFN